MFQTAEDMSQKLHVYESATETSGVGAIKFKTVQVIVVLGVDKRILEVTDTEGNAFHPANLGRLAGKHPHPIATFKLFFVKKCFNDYLIALLVQMVQ